jgi:outer membrane protein TolC
VEQLNMRTRLLAVCVLWSALGPRPAAAGQPPPTAPDPVRLQDLVAEAVERNPDLAAAARQVDVLRERPAQERGLAPPMAGAQIWQWPVNTVNPANTNMYMFMLTQELPGRGKRDLRAAVADTDVAIAESGVAVQTRDIVNAVEQAFASLFIARNAIAVNEDSVALLDQIADVSQAKYRAGRISQQDALKAIVEVSRLRSAILGFEEQAAVASARLNVLLDRAPDAPIGPLEPPTEDEALPAASRLQTLAVDRQPGLAQARLQAARAEAELASVRRDAKPDFSVQGGYMLMPGMNDAWMASVGVSWPTAPWSRGRLDARIAEASAGVSAANARTRAIENAVRLAVQEAYARVQSAQARAALARTTVVPQSRQTLEVSRIAYQADRIDFQDVIDNERGLLDAQLGYFQALSDLAQARADLEYAVGADWRIAGTDATTGDRP